MSGAFAVRPARDADAESLAQVLAVTWDASYRDILPPAAFEEHLAERTPQHWANVIATTERGWNLFTAVDEDDDPVALAATIPDRFGDQRWGEVGMLYVMPGYQRRGIGSALLHRALVALRDSEFRACIVWSLAASNNSTFYERRGGKPLHRRVSSEWGSDIAQIGYVWPDLAALETAPAAAHMGAGA